MHIRSRYRGIADLAKAVLLVEGDIARILGVKVTRQMLRPGLLENSLEELASESVALLFRIDAQRPEVPVISQRGSFVRFGEVSGGMHVAPQASQTDLHRRAAQTRQHQPNGGLRLARWQAASQTVQVRRRVDSAVTLTIVSHHAKKRREQATALPCVGDQVDHQWIILKGFAEEVRGRFDLGGVQKDWFSQYS